MKSRFIQMKSWVLAVLLVILPTCLPVAWAEKQKMPTTPARHLQSDSLLPMVRRMEVPQMHTRMMTSPLPVEIQQRGRQLCIKSRYEQLLPIYTAQGTYYSSLRLTKGTNWLTGLPRGAYMINNRRYTIN